MVKYTVTYFNIKALGEPLRLILCYSNTPFQDKRITFEEWPEIKPTMPLGQLPTLEIDGKVFNQSHALCRYLAKLAKLAGDNDMEALEIDIAVDTLCDFRSKVAAANYEPDPEIKEQKFADLSRETIPFFLKKIESMAAANGGHFACGKLTWADFYFVGILDYLNHICRTDITVGNPHLAAVRDAILALPEIDEWYKSAPKSEY